MDHQVRILNGAHSCSRGYCVCFTLGRRLWVFARLVRSRALVLIPPPARALRYATARHPPASAGCRSWLKQRARSHHHAESCGTVPLMRFWIVVCEIAHIGNAGLHSKLGQPALTPSYNPVPTSHPAPIVDAVGTTLEGATQ